MLDKQAPLELLTRQISKYLIVIFDALLTEVSDVMRAKTEEAVVDVGNISESGNTCCSADPGHSSLCDVLSCQSLFFQLSLALVVFFL